MAAQAVLATTPPGFNPPGVLSPLPPMGFNNWARYMGGLNESLFVDTADAMASKGLLAAGYDRVNLDDEWSLPSRAANGSMQWDPAKFPRGLPWLADFLKSRGFTPGIYTDAGTLSCAGYPGAWGHERLDAETFAGWGFEYLKLDGCNMPAAGGDADADEEEPTYRRAYGAWHEVLASMWPRQLVLSESAPAYFAEAANLTDWYAVMTWAPAYGQLARHSRDALVWNSTSYWPDVTGWDSVLFNYGQEVRLARFQRPGFVNDPDFLNVDHFDYTPDERRSHFALWCALSAPLLLSTDVAALAPGEVAYLTNRDLIAVDQDPLVQQATLVSQDGTWDVLTKSLYNGDRLVAVLNRGDATADLDVSWARIGILLPSDDDGGGGGGGPSGVTAINVKDLWTGDTTTVSLDEQQQLTAKGVPSHGTGVYRLSHPTQGEALRTWPTGMIFNTYSLRCLTDASPGDDGGGGTVAWSNCTAADGQVWRVRPGGEVSSLANPGGCLTVGADGAVVTTSTAEGCGAGGASARWDYFLSGNLVQASSGLCLTEDGPVATATECGYLTNEQVVALPVGVPV